MSLEWNNLYKLGTDVAGFAFFHPKRLEHRKGSATGWWMTDSKEEFQSGRLVAFCTGSDGTFTLKFIRRPLTEMENKVLVVKGCFRYEVLDGRLYWDNTNYLPSEFHDSNAEEDPEGWLEVENGNYRFIVHALDWYSIPDDEREAQEDISHYIVQLVEVASMDEVSVPDEVPWLLASKEWHAEILAERRNRPVD